MVRCSRKGAEENFRKSVSGASPGRSVPLLGTIRGARFALTPLAAPSGLSQRAASTTSSRANQLGQPIPAHVTLIKRDDSVGDRAGERECWRLTEAGDRLSG